VSRHYPVAAVAALVLVLPFAAAAASRSSAPQYRAQANAVCAQEQKMLAALPSGITLPQYLVDAVKIAHTSFASLVKLIPPPALSKLHAEVIANIKAGFPIVNALVARAKAGKLTVAQFQNDTALVANSSKENVLWTKLGAKTCASS
jgi:hypothetical protein